MLRPGATRPDGSAGPKGLAAFAAAHHRGQAGRAVVFPGRDRLTGTLMVAEVLAGSAIAQVRVLAAGLAEPDARLVTRDFVRPQWRAGVLELDAQPAVGGTLVPFEGANPRQCCTDHR